MDLHRELSPLPDLVPLGDVMVAERRLVPRESFTGVQHVRPILIDGLERRGRFVRCHDLTVEGISFWSPESFLTDRLTLTLDRDGLKFELPLDVCHQTPITCLHEPLYLIGCRFLPDNAS